MKHVMRFRSLYEILNENVLYYSLLTKGKWGNINTLYTSTFSSGQYIGIGILFRWEIHYNEIILVPILKYVCIYFSQNLIYRFQIFDYLFTREGL